MPWLSAGCFSGYVTIAGWNLSEAKCGLGGMRDAGGALQHNVFFSQQVSLTSTKLAIALHNTCIRSTQTMVRTPPSGCTEFPNPEDGAWQVSPSGCCDENELTKLVYPQIREKKYGKNAKWPEGYCSIGERVVFHFVIIQENAVD